MEVGMSLARRISSLRPFIGLMKRPISTSSKKKDIITIAETIIRKKPKVVVDGKVLKDDWICYGFNYEREDLDRFTMHFMFFINVTLCLVGGGFMLAYLPDQNAKDWYRREAFLELHRREKLGLPLVNPDLIERSRITLPSEEELGDADVII